MDKKLFVTCGATVPFPELIKCIISKQFIELALKQFNYNEFIIQYGLGYGDLFGKMIYFLYGVERLKMEESVETFGCSEVRKYVLFEGKLIIYGLEYSTKIQDLIETSTLVISHAGTGSILDTLRNSHIKPLIVVVNDTLMDNHQEQIASRFENMGYIVSCHTNIEELTTALVSLETHTKTLTPFPQSHNPQFAQLLTNTAQH